jgi:hypothetical protein
MLGPLDLPRLAPEQRPLHRDHVQVIAGHLDLDDDLVVRARLRPRRGERAHARGLAHEEQAIEAHLREVQLGRLLPVGCAAGDLLRLLGERLLRELFELPHGRTRDRSRGSSRLSTMDHVVNDPTPRPLPRPLRAPFSPPSGLLT